jgi:hypothetical protein
MDLLQSLNGVVQGSHHLHLELEELLRGQWWRHRQRLTGTLVVLLLLVRTGTGAPGVHHLIATNEIYENKISCSREKETSEGYDRKKRNIGFTPNILTQFYYLVRVGLGRFA